MKKDPIITKKPSPALLKMHLQLEFEFIMAVVSKNLDMLRDLLHEDGVYFGKYSKYQALHFFRNQFKEWTTNDGQIHKVDPQVALGKYCGMRTLVFENGKFPALKEGQKDISIILNIEGDQIMGLSLCNAYITHDEFNTASEHN